MTPGTPVHVASGRGAAVRCREQRERRGWSAELRARPNPAGSPVVDDVPALVGGRGRVRTGAFRMHTSPASSGRRDILEVAAAGIAALAFAGGTAWTVNTDATTADGAVGTAAGGPHALRTFSAAGTVESLVHPLPGQPTAVLR